MDTIERILEALQQNVFDPTIHLEARISDTPGNYILCLRKGATLPSVGVELKLTPFNELGVIYTGLTKESLRKRDYKQHFTGNNAGRSTLRKSIGVLFGYKQIPRDKDPSTGKTKFNAYDEERLTQWMLLNLLMYFMPNKTPKSQEDMLIKYFNPPLNLQGNYSSINSDFRVRLSRLRGAKD